MHILPRVIGQTSVFVGDYWILRAGINYSRCFPGLKSAGQHEFSGGLLKEYKNPGRFLHPLRACQVKRI